MLAWGNIKLQDLNSLYVIKLTGNEKLCPYFLSEISVCYAMAGVHAKEPKDLYLTENLSRHQLHPESSPIKRSDLLLIPEPKPHQVGPYFFFQILNHRRPEGDKNWAVLLDKRKCIICTLCRSCDGDVMSASVFQVTIHSSENSFVHFRFRGSSSSSTAVAVLDMVTAKKGI